MLVLQRISWVSLSVLTAALLVLSAAWACKEHEQQPEESKPDAAKQAVSYESLPHAYSAFSPAIMAGSIEVTETQKAMVSQYIKTQVVANGLTMHQFASMSPEQQRRILTPGQTLSQVERRVLQSQMGEDVIPKSIQQGIIPLAVVEPEVVQKYGVMLPNSVQTNLKMPAGISMVLFGNTLAALNHSGAVLSVTEEIY